MGGKESSHVDSSYFQGVSFHLNILVCGDFPEGILENELENIKKVDKYKGLTYYKKGTHKNIPKWYYYFFPKDDKIGETTFDFICNSITKDKDNSNVILFFSGLSDYTYKDIISFYDQKPSIYHSNIIIVTKRYESFLLPQLKKMNVNFIRNAEENNEIDIYVNLIEVSSYCNQLGDEIGFPKNIVKEELLEKDNELMIKYSFTFNIIVCGKPGAGKSTLINSIVGKEKCYSAKGTSSLTQKVTKYICEKYPILIYDTPGFEKPEDIKRIQTLIRNKNQSLNEERNRIHCVLYVMNTKAERTFIDKEYEFLVDLLNQDMDIFFIATHAGTKENAEDYIEATRVNLEQNSNGDKRIVNLREHIFPVELNDEEHYKKFGIKEVFTSLYNKYEKEKYNHQITDNNLKSIKSPFLGEIISKDKVKAKLTALSRRVKANFKLLASSLGNSPMVKGTTSLSTAVIKIISKIYNHPITTGECLDYIESKNYTNELKNSDSFGRIVEKSFATVFYANGPAAKEVDYLAECLISEYNAELNNDRKFYDYLINK
jgi:GTPase Era involved in 16S rRNA processing